MNQMFVDVRNFKSDPDCVKHLPIANDGANLYEKCKDGILLWLVIVFYVFALLKLNSVKR